MVAEPHTSLGQCRVAAGVPCVADLVKCNLVVNEAKRGRDVSPRYPSVLKIDSFCLEQQLTQDTRVVKGTMRSRHTGRVKVT